MNKILLVDDEESIRNMMRMTLELDGYSVLTAADGPSALTIFQDEFPDVVLLDVRMPGMDGVEALRRMLAEFGDHCHYYECPANEDGPCDCFAGNLVIDCLDVLGKAILEKKQG